MRASQAVTTGEHVIVAREELSRAVWQGRAESLDANERKRVVSDLDAIRELVDQVRVTVTGEPAPG